MPRAAGGSNAEWRPQLVLAHARAEASSACIIAPRRAGRSFPSVLDMGRWKMRIEVRLRTVAAALALVFNSGAASPAEPPFPARALRLVVGFAPGGATDIA